MSFLKKNWRVTLAITAPVLGLIVGTFMLYDTDKPQEPNPVYVMLERSDDEGVLDAGNKNSLSPRERKKRLKIVDNFFDELDRDFEKIDGDREALFARSDELEENYFAYIYAIADLLSPEYRQRFDEIESHDELTQAEKDAINDELYAIGKELGIDDMDEYMRSAAEEFIDKFLALQAAVDKLDEEEAQLIKEMEEFSPHK